MTGRNAPRPPLVFRLARMLAWLAVGAAITVGVAWGVVLTSGSYWFMKDREPISAPVWSGAWPADWRPPSRSEQQYAAGVVITGSAEEPLWIPGLHSRVHRWQTAWCFGLPCQSLRYLERSEGIMPAGGTPIAVTDWGDRGLGDIRNRVGEIRHLPIRPLWPGFAINTLFYAALAWGLWQVPLALRRWRRKKKGLCGKCGYDLKGIKEGTACPECGTKPA